MFQDVPGWSITEEKNESELQKVLDPGNQVNPRKSSALTENFSGEVCLHKEEMIVLYNFLNRENLYDLSILYIDHNFQ